MHVSFWFDQAHVRLRSSLYSLEDLGQLLSETSKVIRWIQVISKAHL